MQTSGSRRRFHLKLALRCRGCPRCGILYSYTNPLQQQQHSSAFQCRIAYGGMCARGEQQRHFSLIPWSIYLGNVFARALQKPLFYANVSIFPAEHRGLQRQRKLLLCVFYEMQFHLVSFQKKILLCIIDIFSIRLMETCPVTVIV